MASTANRYHQPHTRQERDDMDIISAAIRNKAKMQQGRTHSNYSVCLYTRPLDNNNMYNRFQSYHRMDTTILVVIR